MGDSKYTIRSNERRFLGKSSRRELVLEAGEEIRKGKNELIIELLNERTKLVIVGTLIPAKLPFFYAGKSNYIYSWIDQATGNTHLNDFKKELANNPADKKRIIKLIKDELKKIGVVFIDVIDEARIKEGSRRDEDISEYHLDINVLNRLKELSKTNTNMKIIAASRNAEAVLHSFNIEKVEYSTLMWNPRRDSWINIIKESQSK